MGGRNLRPVAPRALTTQLLADLQHPGVEVDPIPRQPERLAEPQADRDGDRVQGVEPVIGQGGEDAAGLVGGQSLGVVPLHAGALDDGHGVPVEDAVLDGLLDCGVQGGADVQRRLRGEPAGGEGLEELADVLGGEPVEAHASDDVGDVGDIGAVGGDGLGGAGPFEAVEPPVEVVAQELAGFAGVEIAGDEALELAEGLVGLLLVGADAAEVAAAAGGGEAVLDLGDPLPVAALVDGAGALRALLLTGLRCGLLGHAFPCCGESLVSHSVSHRDSP